MRSTRAGGGQKLSPPRLTILACRGSSFSIFSAEKFGRRVESAGIDVPMRVCGTARRAPQRYPCSCRLLGWPSSILPRPRRFLMPCRSNLPVPSNPTLSWSTIAPDQARFSRHDKNSVLHASRRLSSASREYIKSMRSSIAGSSRILAAIRSLAAALILSIRSGLRSRSMLPRMISNNASAEYANILKSGKSLLTAAAARSTDTPFIIRS